MKRGMTTRPGIENGRRRGTRASGFGALRTAALLCLLAAIPVSCSGPTVAAFGEVNDVVVLAGDEAAGRAAEILSGALTAKSSWLVGESRFETRVARIGELDDFTYRRNIVLLGTWDDPEIAGIVDSRVGGLGAGDPPGSKAVEDIWGEGQVVMAVMAGTREELVEYLSSHGEDVVEKLVDSIRDRLARRLREELEATGFDRDMEARFGWSLGPPSGYDLHPRNESDGLVFFRKTKPDRTVFVHWLPGTAEEVTEELMAERRDEIGSLYFDGDAIEWRRQLVVEKVRLAGRPALCMSGWWGNRELVGGGPFRSYCFHVPSQQRIYLIDAALFAPGLDKTELMRNLDAALHTFRAAD
ncbi:MAG: DUF4837 family protein [Candidatus Eisenbacteria bacterium]|nr:DUF4837 family protein [Candidatus Eisenbacteria bacterium]